MPRHDHRKERLKENIRQTLEKVSLYSAFEKQMQSLGYKVIKGRGISFIDDKKVKVKGSEVGFSFAKIDRILSIKQQMEINKAKQQMQVGDTRPFMTYSKSCFGNGVQVRFLFWALENQVVIKVTEKWPFAFACNL